MLEVSLAVRCGNTISETFPTDTGAPQGDCASANEFTYYLAKSLGEPTPFIHDHHYFQRTITDHEIPEELQDHNYAQHNQVQHISIDMEYADDLSEISSDNNKMRRSELDKIAKLSDKGLQVNDTKTERFVISKQNDNWKKCKLLGSFRYRRRDQETQSTSHQCSKQSPAFLQQQTPHHRDKDTHHEYIHRANLYVQFRNLDYLLTLSRGD